MQILLKIGKQKLNEFVQKHAMDCKLESSSWISADHNILIIEENNDLKNYIRDVYEDCDYGKNHINESSQN